ncbi:hypothetical protein GCM10022420_095090 [Streptomyces iranensis]
MLGVAGALAEGTIAVWAGPKALADHIVPALTRAATGAAVGPRHAWSPSHRCV